jgi:hypothetical protein
MARRLVAIDTTALNIGSDIACRMFASGDGPVSAESDLQRRAYLPPRLEQVTPAARRRRFRVSRAKGSALDNDAFNALVYGLFNPDRGPRVLSMRTDPEDADTEYRAVASVLDFGEEEPPVTWVGVFEFVEPDWLKAVTVVSSASPLTVGGNVPARPLITLTGGDSCTRRRLTVKDRTGHAIASFPRRVAASADDEAFVFLDGLQVPYALDGTDLIFRAAAQAGQSAYVDIYTGTGVTNSDYANRLDAGGMDLTTLTDTQVEVAASGVQANPGSAALSWRPGITTRHAESRNYTFGLDGDEVRLIDREATGVVVTLPDDADSLVLASPVEISQVTFSFEVETGRIAGADDAAPGAGETDERVMRVTIADYDGEPTPENAATWPAGAPTGGSLFPWYAQWTFGQTTFPNTYVETGVTNQSGFDSADRWHNVAEPSDFPALAAEWIGVPLTTGAPGVYYLHFVEDAFHGVEIPLLSMTITPRGATFVAGGDTDTVIADAGPKPAELFEALWVDPETLEPIVEGETPAAAQTGMARAVVKYLPRASEDWVTARAWNVAGTPESVVEAIEDVTVSTPGAVAVAIGLEPLAALPNTLDWGRLTLTAPALVEFQSAKTPQVTSATVAANRADGVLRNVTDAQQLELVNTFYDGGGLEIDAASLAIRGAGGVGPVYGEIRPSGGVRLFDLPPGDVDWTNSTGASVEFEFAERLRI